MPIYEYRCGACGHQQEFLQRHSDAPLTECPACGKRALSKLVSAAGFQLKGTGWYATDFRNSGAKPAAKQDKAADGAGKEPSKDSATTSTHAGAGSVASDILTRSGAHLRADRP
jgi:putative FmdB family regulatory protein